ncbi:MAG: glycosyltransferase [Porphyrobacter sp.]|nr:glycosyltransferase [Porphyrobacter sp.]
MNRPRSQRVRIVVPIHSFEPGGVERVALRLAAAWQSAGEEVTVVLGRAEGAGRTEEAGGLPYRTYRSFVRTARFETIWMIVCLYRYLRSEPADVIFCPGNTYTVVCAALRLLLGGRCPPVVAKVSNDLRRADMPAPARLGYRAWVRAHAWIVDRFVAIAEPMAAEVAEEVGVDPNRVSVVPDPALTAAEWERLSAREPRPCPVDGALIVGVGRLVRQKNFPLLLRAFASQAPAHDRLLIAGEGPEMARLQGLAARLGIGDRTTFAGHCADVLSLLERTDIFALPSDYEGVPAVMVEALAGGVPIVATECSGSISWLAGFGRDAIVVPVGDVERFGRALREVRDLPLPGRDGRTRAAQFTLEQAAGSYLGLFEAEIAARNRPGWTAPREAKQRAPAS